MSPVSVDSAAVAAFLGCPIDGPVNRVVTVTSIDEPVHGALSFYTGNDSSRLSGWSDHSGTILCDPSVSVPISCSRISSLRPRLDFALALREFMVEKMVPKVSDSARVDSSATVGAGATIGEYVVIERDCVIGERVTIGHHTTLLRGTVIGNDVVIGSSTVIGTTGFGLEQDDDGAWVRIPHFGHVEVGDGVEIGSSCVIARGTIGTTRIASGCRIDDQVFIAHNVQMDENCVVIANAEVSGSVRVGRGSWIGPHSTIIEQVRIGSNSLVGLGAVVIRDVPDDVVVAGNPAKVIRGR